MKTRAAYCEIDSMDLVGIYSSVADEFSRLASQAERLSTLSQKRVSVAIHHFGLRLPAAWLSPFWSSMEHVVRNAIDHGIESPEERISLGKPCTGQLTFASETINGWLEIKLSDDGRGIDWQRIRSKALEHGFEFQSGEQLGNTLFRDGFSTRDEANEHNIHGTGLNAVLQACKQRGGTISVITEHGKGTSFIFRFPMEDSIESYMDANISVPPTKCRI